MFLLLGAMSVDASVDLLVGGGVADAVIIIGNVVVIAVAVVVDHLGRGSTRCDRGVQLHTGAGAVYFRSRTRGVTGEDISC